MALVEFGKRLKTVMEQRGETPQSVADELGITPQAVHKWMRGGSEITLSNLRTLAKFLNVNWLWLRYGDNVVMELATPSQTVSPVEQYRQRLIGEMIEGERRRRWVLETLGFGLCVFVVLSVVRFWGLFFCLILLFF